MVLQVQGKPRVAGHTKGRFAAAQADFVRTPKAKRQSRPAPKKAQPKDSKKFTPKGGKGGKGQARPGKGQGKPKGKPKGK
jgi:hypothetical protein